MRRFIPNFAEIVKHITNMLKNNSDIKWINESKKSFYIINISLTKAPVLITPDYSKDFLIFSFAFEDTIVVVLLQKNTKGFEHPIGFFNNALRDAELKNNIMEKQSYALVMELKSFKVYMLHSKVIEYVPSNTIREILMQTDSDGKKGRWIPKILEYDLEIKPTKLVKWKGLAKIWIQTNCKALGIHFIFNSSACNESWDGEQNFQVHERFLSSSWYKYIVYFLQAFQCPLGMDKSKMRSFKLKAIKYCILDQFLFQKDPRGILLNCVEEGEAQRIMIEMHKGAYDGHHYWKAIAYKILRSRYYWPTLFSDVFAKVRACMEC